MKRIAVFASGSGTNADNIIRYFSSSGKARVVLLVTDNQHAGAIARANVLGIPTEYIPRAEIRLADSLLPILNDRKIDYIVLAGYLSLIPAEVTRLYKGRMINVHPALLPAYGGKGMYGDRVHQAVIANREVRSGITIHAVNERYDEGSIIAQYDVAVEPDDTPETLAAKIHELEYRWFPVIIESEIDKIT